jgi:hypothetical protein
MVGGGILFASLGAGGHAAKTQTASTTTTSPGKLGGAYTPGPSTSTPTAASLLGDEAALTLHSHATLAFLPYAGNSITVSYAAADGRKAVINVIYSGSLIHAKTALAALLVRHGDSAVDYVIHFRSKQAAAQALDDGLRLNLAANGFVLLSYLPLRGQTFTVTFLGQRGQNVALLVNYRTSKAAAERALDAFIFTHGDRPSHYLVSYRPSGK